MIAKIHSFIPMDLNLAEGEQAKPTEFVDRISRTTLEAFWIEIVRGQEGCTRVDIML